MRDPVCSVSAALEINVLD